MSNVNRIYLIGRLTADPEQKSVGSGTALTKFNLAVDRPVKQGTTEQSADFIPVVTWNSLAEICGKYLKKGRQVYVGGRIQIRKYQTAEQETRYVTEIIANEMKMLDKATGPSTVPAPETSSVELNSAAFDSGVEYSYDANALGGEPEPALVEDDIPF